MGQTSVKTNDKSGVDDGKPATLRRRSSSISAGNDDGLTAPMQIIGSICEDGLGAISWWQEQNEIEN